MPHMSLQGQKQGFSAHEVALNSFWHPPPLHIGQYCNVIKYWDT